jgi:hypothetical protein
MNTVHDILGSAVAEISSTENWTIALSDPSQHLTFLAIGLVVAIAVIAIGGMILGQLCLMPTRRCSGGYATSKGRSTGGFWIALCFIVGVAIYYGSQNGGHGVGVPILHGLLAHVGVGS